MTISVHYLDDDTVNAFATLGGQVFIFRGLLRRVRSENALAMVMAHEIAHVKNRDPLRSMGRGVVIAAALAVIDASLGTRLAGDALGQAGLLTQLRFSRAQEGAADQAALAALAARYGGTAGFEGLFRILAAAHPGKGPPGSGIYRSHPQIAARVAALEHQARSHGWSRGRVTPLPPAFPAWLKAAAKAGPESAGTRP